MVGLIHDGCSKNLEDLAPFPCALDGTCPEGFNCDATIGCVLAACVSVTVTSPCDICGADAPVPCADGSFCPLNSECRPGGICECLYPFHAFDCDGVRCNGACLSTDAYQCAPLSPIAELACSTIPGPAGALCACRDGRTIAARCGDLATCEDRCSQCDLPSGACAGEQKCTLIDPDGDTTVTPGCSPILGSLAEHAACERQGDVLGADACGPGLFCSDLAKASDLECLKLCYSDAGCGPDQACVSVVTSPVNAGVCLEKCELFDGDGCSASQKCAVLRSSAPKLRGIVPRVSVCGAAGAGGPETVCTADAECAAGLVCAGGEGNLICRELCDAGHACPSGLTCAPQKSFPSGAGFCL